MTQFAKMESNRFRYYQKDKSQRQFRAYLYQGLCDGVDNGDPRQRGYRIILPTSHTGGPRNMVQNYQDAMAIVRKHGKPDLFITVTCNPNWPEIKAELLPGQQANDRPDLIARVFNLKLKALLREIEYDEIFGRVSAIIHVVEFQKRYAQKFVG